MTLTRLLPTLRRSIPDPIDPDAWPAATSATITDVEVGGVSLLRLVELCGTPAVHLGVAVVCGTGGHPAASAGSTGVAVARVVGASADRSDRTVTIDAELTSLDPAWSEARLIGRASVARATPTTIRSVSGCLAPAPIALPADIEVGDLLALPYATVTDEAGIARPVSGWLAPIAETAQQTRTL